MPFGQLVVGPPGSGKSTYCDGMQQFLRLLGRKVAVVNLDPANDQLSYDCAINISDLVRLDEVMLQHNLGPNGGLVFCMEFLEKNSDWLLAKLRPLAGDHYFLFDLPGQVELFTLHSSLKRVVQQLTREQDYRLVAVHLTDSHLCSDAAKFVSALLVSLSSMLHLELPAVNVLSKMDLVEKYGKLAFNLDFYTEVQDLSQLQLQLGDDPFFAKFRKLTAGLCEVVQDFSLVSFETLCITDKESVWNLLRIIDKVNGYAFASVEGSVAQYSQLAARPLDWDANRVAEVQERHMRE